MNAPTATIVSVPMLACEECLVDVPTSDIYIEDDGRALCGPCGDAADNLNMPSLTSAFSHNILKEMDAAA